MRIASESAHSDGACRGDGFRVTARARESRSVGAPSARCCSGSESRVHAHGARSSRYSEDPDVHPLADPALSCARVFVCACDNACACECVCARARARLASCLRRNECIAVNMLAVSMQSIALQSIALQSACSQYACSQHAVNSLAVKMQSICLQSACSQYACSQHACMRQGPTTVPRPRAAWAGRADASF